MDYRDAAAMVFQRTARFCDGYDVNTELKKLLTKFFGNKKSLEKLGLKFFYQKLREYIIEKKLIGLIIYGSKIKYINSHDIINIYTTLDNKNIHLYPNELCRFLLEEYFTEREIRDNCFNTPNFNIYYKQ